MWARRPASSLKLLKLLKRAEILTLQLLKRC
jgi:hypothetical protein